MGTCHELLESYQNFMNAIGIALFWYSMGTFIVLGSYAATHSSSIGIYDQGAVSITAIATIVFWYVVGAWIDLRIRKKDLATAPA